MHLIDPKPLARSERVALVLGVSQAVQGFVDLPNVPREVAEVHQIEGGRTLVDAEFSRARFASELQTSPYNIVHIASHGQFATDPAHTFILSYDAPLTMNDLETDIKFGERRGDNALELLVLSACETASGDDRAALGLAGIALKAGARSALASLWYVSDEAARELVVDFYRGLSQGMTKAHALQAAQRQLIARHPFEHPAFWAPFLLIGNWL
jgi:CHAT domain-containing protein